MVDTSTVKLATVVRFRWLLPKDEVTRRYQKRFLEFRQLPGLVQKFYVYDESTEEWGGIYQGDSKESAQQYLASDLRKSIPAAYEVDGTPRVDMLSVIEFLRRSGES